MRNQGLREVMPGAAQQEVAELGFRFRLVDSKDSPSSLLRRMAAILATESW